MQRTAALIVCALVLAACGSGESAPRAAEDRSDLIGDWSPAPITLDGLTTIASTVGDRMVVYTADGERDFIAGVNLGPTVPGTWPGEQAIPREVFRRWFPQMRDVGIRALRVYTIMTPAFYEELRDFNLANPETPLLLAHGVWIPERNLEHGDLFHPGLVDEFRAEMADAVAVVHGDASLPMRSGHAHGEYRADVSQWLVSWLVGVEWDPQVIRASDEANSDVRSYAGVYFENQGDPSPTEVWLAQALDELATLEAARGVSMPLAFVNWPTTDPLDHPDEPLETEDLVGIDANTIRPTAEWPGGYYATYHAYPYYPDFQRHEAGIAEFVHQGRTDAYAGYLTALQAHHRDLPVVISEFGVPSGLAHAHFGPQGRNQGAHSEQDQMAINAELLDVIREVGLAGGFVFEWADEWFKHTWNTVDYEIPADRRALWQNMWTNEAHFGILAVGAGDTPVVIIDGEESEWDDNGSQVIFESPVGVREVRAVKDESFLHLLIRTDGDDVWREQPVVIGIDVIAGGGGGLPGANGADPDADYAVVIGPTEDDGSVMVRASNDPYAIQYAWQRGYEDVDPEDFSDDSGVWNLQRLIVNRPHLLASGEALPVEVMEAGRMIFGTSDPAATEFDSRATWNGSGSIIEVRLPYQAIGFADPSSMLAYRVGQDGQVSTESVERIGITVAHAGNLYETTGYAWERWQSASWHERLKAGAAALGAAFERGNGLGGD
jgi:hypothetical protein